MTRLLLLGVIGVCIAACGVQGPLYRTDAPPPPKQKLKERKERKPAYGELSPQDQNILPDLLY